MAECADLRKLQQLLDRFIAERKWEVYHRPKNLAMSVAIEAAELMEHFQWCDRDPEEFDEEELQAIGEEMADVLHYLLRLSSVLGIDLYEASLAKIEKNRRRFPIEEAMRMKKKGC